ncbi:hypothetical protein CEXT_647091 [Caerostris extrusa]|uniref:Uncharacterized protein n=1 Tax=Caerostris extrusa TaxID=172846 RepID=A0AAV4MQ69_CAEEX|nr:hypothetical protein CEXT_647091 [Caerostris extrusa]
MIAIQKILILPIIYLHFERFHPLRARGSSAGKEVERETNFFERSQKKRMKVYWKRHLGNTLTQLPIPLYLYA